MALSFEKKIMLQSHQAVVLCHSKKDKGEPFFHYILCGSREIEQMQRDYQSKKAVDFSSYGRIVLSGWGNPTADHELILREIFPPLM